MPWTLDQPVSHELIVKKSRFLACVQPVEGRAQALEVVAASRAAHPDATHVCWAVLAGGALLVHVVLWIRARYADPYLLPIAVALNGLGLAMIHRIDLSTGQTAANTQVVWTAVAMVTCCVVLWLSSTFQKKVS